MPFDLLIGKMDATKKSRNSPRVINIVQVYYNIMLHLSKYELRGFSK